MLALTRRTPGTVRPAAHETEIDEGGPWTQPPGPSGRRRHGDPDWRDRAGRGPGGRGCALHAPCAGLRRGRRGRAAGREPQARGRGVAGRRHDRRRQERRAGCGPAPPGGARPRPRGGGREPALAARRPRAPPGRQDVRARGGARAADPRARARRRHVGLAGPPAAAQGARGPDPPRPREGRPRRRGGDEAGGRPARPQHPLRRDAAARRRPCRGDDRQRRPALRRRHEGPHHRARGPQHPRPRAPDRRRLHHRRHAERRDPLRLRRRPARDRAHDAGEAAPGRPHPSRADRGDLLPGQVGARGAHRRVRRAGLLRRQRAGARPGAVRGPRTAQVPHLLRPERARALGRVRPPRGDDGPRAGRVPQDRAPRRAPARHRQGRLARGRGPARAGRR